MRCAPALVMALSATLAACKGDSSNGSAGAAPSGSGAPPPFALGVPYPAASVAAVINPKGEPPYTGPTGTLRGTIRVKGDPAPDMKLSFPSQCAEAAATYGKAFRVGQDGTVADVLVAVTNYTGFVPAKEEAKKMIVRGCAFSTRTLSVTFGQRIEISNTDQTESYMPYLEGTRAAAILVAVPGGDAVRLYPHAQGRYLIRDQLPKPFMSTEVFVLAYSTHDVTGLDGQYEIKGIPVGKARVNALLPAIGKTIGQEVEIKPGDTTLDMMFEYSPSDVARINPVGPGSPSGTPPAASASAGGAKPAGSASAPKK
jgi:hypothetical protein